MLKEQIQSDLNEAIKSQDILEMTSKIKIQKDSNLVASKEVDPAKIGVTTKNGQTFVEQSHMTPGSPGTQLPFSTYERKFRDCASYATKQLSDTQIDDIISCIEQLEEIDNIRKLIGLLSP